MNFRDPAADPPPVRPERFDPAILNRSLIAIPLLEAMKEAERWFGNAEKGTKGKVPTADPPWNAVILCAPRTPVGKMASELRSKLDEEIAQLANRPDASPEKVARLQANNQLGKRMRGTTAFYARLDRRVAEALLDANRPRAVEDEEEPLRVRRIVRDEFDVIISLNLDYTEGRDQARIDALTRIDQVRRQTGTATESDRRNLLGGSVNQYIFERLSRAQLESLARRETDQGLEESAKVSANALPPSAPRANALSPTKNPIYQIWPDFVVETCVTRSLATVKANAAQQSFAAMGDGLTWAVMDTGVQADHPHFRKHRNLEFAPHFSFLPPSGDVVASGLGDDPCIDPNGHGTHVAGIIAGEWTPDDATPNLDAVFCVLDEKGDEVAGRTKIFAISGMAPKCRIASFKVLNERGKGQTSAIIAAIAQVQELNGYGRRLVIHGVNISIGYPFEPKWFGCGQSPLCVEVDRLVKSGVVVVVAAGNTGYGTVNSGSSSAGLSVTINDPGNSELAITVGSTHRDMPYTYGVSFFSSKGPTGDGRPKPDLLAPGEKIISCASSGGATYDPEATGATLLRREAAKGEKCDYLETSGTSMAAPHVSGVIAAFLSIRREFIGQPERVKQIFVSTASDLRRDRYFQGAGLIDLMRAIQSV